MRFFDITFVGPDDELHGFVIAATSKEQAQEIFASTGCDIIMVMEVKGDDDEGSPLSVSVSEAQTDRDRRGANKWK